MKVRITGNSLRLRLLRSEVARLLAGECLEEAIHFTPEANARFTYALQQDTAARVPAIQYSEGRVDILIPADQARTWGSSNQVGIAADISLGAFGSLALLVEKDFACLDGSEDDNQDTFPNPCAGAKC